MSTSKIEWTEAVWNPVTGCSKISSGCKHCYAERMAMRLKAMGTPNYANGFVPAMHPDMLRRPFEWSKPRLVFVNSMSDLFHEDVSNSFIHDIFDVIRKTPQHTYQILTKRAERLAEFADKLSWPDNIWMGVTVESSDYLHRIDLLKSISVSIRFISFEPLLSPICNTNLSGIDWVIVGGESGPGARPMQKEWVTLLRDECLEQGTSFFFKQWGGKNKKKAGRMLDGRIWDQMPLQQPLHQKNVSI